MSQSAVAVEVSGGDSGLWVETSAVAEGAGQGGGAGLVVQGRSAVVDSAVDADRPHGGGVPVTVAVVVFAPVSRRPHVDAAFAVSSLLTKTSLPLTNLAFLYTKKD